MSCIGMCKQSYIRRSKMSSIFRDSGTCEVFKLLDGSAKQYLMAKSQRDEAAKDVDRCRQHLGALLERLRAEFGLQK